MLSHTKQNSVTGLDFCLYFFVVLVFAFNRQQDPSVNLLAILVGTGSLQVWILVSGGVYNNWCLDALEASFTLNFMNHPSWYHRPCQLLGRK